MTTQARASSPACVGPAAGASAPSASLDHIVAAGPAMFDQGDVAILLQTALDGIAAIQHLGCHPI